MCLDEFKLGETPSTACNTDRQSGENTELNPKIWTQIDRPNIFEVLQNLSRLHLVARNYERDLFKFLAELSSTRSES